MDEWSNIVESFPLSMGNILQQYSRIPSDSSDIFYHYTTHKGLEGILKSGGLRATYRMKMNDAVEFKYARDIIYKSLDRLNRMHNISKVEQSLTRYIRINLDKLLSDSIESSCSYCACFTVSLDDPNQLEIYAEKGKGFAIGFNFLNLLTTQVPNVSNRQPYLFCAPVIYNECSQLDLVYRLVKAGINDLRTFAHTHSQESLILTLLRDRIMKEIVIHLLTIIDFIKTSDYSREREIRMMLDSNDGTLKVSNIQYYEKDDESIPFIFMDLCDPITKRLTLEEIWIGPKALFTEEKIFVEGLLDELGYGSNYKDRPRFSHSRVVMNRLPLA